MSASTGRQRQEWNFFSVLLVSLSKYHYPKKIDGLKGSQFKNKENQLIITHGHVIYLLCKYTLLRSCVSQFEYYYVLGMGCVLRYFPYIMTILHFHTASLSIWNQTGPCEAYNMGIFSHGFTCNLDFSQLRDSM